MSATGASCNRLQGSPGELFGELFTMAEKMGARGARSCLRRRLFLDTPARLRGQHRQAQSYRNEQPEPAFFREEDESIRGAFSSVESACEPGVDDPPALWGGLPLVFPSPEVVDPAVVGAVRSVVEEVP